MRYLKLVPVADPTPKAIQHASDLGRAYELPDVDVPRLAQYPGQELISSRTVRAREDLTGDSAAGESTLPST